MEEHVKRSSSQLPENPSASERTDRARRLCYQIWALVGAIIITGVVVYLLKILTAPVGIVLWTCVIVFCLRGPVNWLEARGINRMIGTIFAYVLMFVVLAIVFVLMFSPMFGFGNQVMNLVESLPTYVQQITEWANETYDQYGYLLQNSTVEDWLDSLAASLSSWAGETARVSASGLVSVGSAIAGSLVVLGFALVVAFWILMDLPAIGRECWRFIDDAHHDDAVVLHLTFTRVMGGYIKATLVQCLLIGVACGIAFVIIGVPNHAAIGGLTGLLNIIPVIGPWLGGAIAALSCVFVSPWMAFVALLVTIVIQQFVYTFVSPKLMSDSVDIHPALVFVALLTGSALGGAMNGPLGSFVGMLASIPSVAVLKSLFMYYFEKNTGRRIVSEDGVFFKGPSSYDKKVTADPLANTAAPIPSYEESLWHPQNGAYEPHEGVQSPSAQSGSHLEESLSQQRQSESKRPECDDGDGSEQISDGGGFDAAAVEDEMATTTDRKEE